MNLYIRDKRVNKKLIYLIQILNQIHQFLLIQNEKTLRNKNVL
jgi:hypothetical protein